MSQLTESDGMTSSSIKRTHAHGNGPPAICTYTQKAKGHERARTLTKMYPN